MHRRTHQVIQPLPEQGPGAVKTGGVNHYQLAGLGGLDGPDSTPSGLGLGAGDRYLFAGNCIGES